MSAEDRAEVENKVTSLREALKGSDIDAVKTGATSLAETLSQVSTKAYQASAADASANGAGADGSAGDGPAQEPGAATGEETVEGEFKEV